MIDNKFKFSVWRMNRFNSSQSMALVAYFDDIELAKDFVDYQATIGNTYAVFIRDSLTCVYNPCLDDI
jgi:hypothetical protein